MAIPLVAGNWKMNTTLQEAVALATDLRDALDDLAGVVKVICPPFISLDRVAQTIQGSTLKVGAQNMHDEEKGAFTGEVSASMLQGLCKYVILGHSERRSLFSETDELVNRKIRKVLGAGLSPILCIGENFDEKKEGREESVVSESLIACLEGVASSDALVIAYEPVWAIGTGMAATGEQAEAMVALIRRLLADQYGHQDAQAVSILYGGSVTVANIQEFTSQPNIDGALVGGASLDAQQFAEIVRITDRARSAG